MFNFTESKGLFCGCQDSKTKKHTKTGRKMDSSRNNQYIDSSFDFESLKT